jgi:hypothetical protein
MFKSPTIRSGGNAKTIKGDKLGTYETAIMYLAPFRSAMGGNVCAMAETAGCVAGCLNTAGRGAFNNVQAARVAKTRRYFADRAAFMADLSRDVAAFVRHCARKGINPAIRLNGTSDIAWETAHPCYRDGVRFASIFEAFPEVRFYDYTKIAKRVRKALPANYDLTLSFSEANLSYAYSIRMTAAETGANVAVVFRTKALRDAYMVTGFEGVEVIDGDETDLRFTDPKGVVVGLYAKGQAKGDRSGFVID